MNRTRKAQSLAVVNSHLREVVESVLLEVMTGVTRTRLTDQAYVITFDIGKQGLVAEVRTGDGGHCGSWAVKVHAI